MKTSINTAGKFLFFTGLAGLACLGVKRCNDFMDKPFLIQSEVTKPEFYSDKMGSFIEFTTGISDLGRDGYIVDEDNDGNADVIQYCASVRWIASNHKTKKYITDNRTKTMTPEIQSAATEALNLDRKLAQLIAEESYRLQEENNK